MKIFSGSLIVLSLLLTAFLQKAAAEATFTDTASAIEVVSGQYRFVISKEKCTIFDTVWKGGQKVAGEGSVSFQDKQLRSIQAEKPVRVSLQQEHSRIYSEGWFASANNPKFLYYILRYEFYDNSPCVKLVLTVTDRHDSPKTEAQWDEYWKNQLVSHVKLALHVPGITRSVAVEQINSFSYKLNDEQGDHPYFEIAERKGSPPGFLVDTSEAGRATGVRQLVLSAKSSDNWLRFYPAREGTFPLALKWTKYPDFAAYMRAKGANAKIAGKNGEKRIVFDQEADSWMQLGDYPLDKKSYIELNGERRDGNLLIEAFKVGTEIVPPFQHHSGSLQDRDFSFAVKDFWKNYPISMQMVPGLAIVDCITEPAIFMGGMGKTFEIIYSFGESGEAVRKLYAPPPVADTARFSDSLYFSLAQNRNYQQLTDEVRKKLPTFLENQKSLGWRNWGDYQIGLSYDQTEDWGNLQYDLAYGLLVLYIRTQDPEMWNLAQAAVYHMMDIDLVKFSPFLAKYNGGMHRKGETPREFAHVATEPVVPQNFAFRGLYLYYLLTGDQFARDCAKMSVDNLLEFTTSESRIDFAAGGDRDTAWILLGLLFGYEKFGKELYLQRAMKVVQKLAEKEKSMGRLPGTQPVWQGQLLEALIRFYEITHDESVKEMLVRHTSWLKEYAFVRDPVSGRYSMVYLMKEKDKIPQHPEMTDESNYFFLHLNALYYVSVLTQDSSLKKLADSLFLQACRENAEFQGPRQASSFLGFPFYYLSHSSQ